MTETPTKPVEQPTEPMDPAELPDAPEEPDETPAHPTVAPEAEPEEPTDSFAPPVRASLQFIVDAKDEQALIQLGAVAAAALSEHTTVYSSAQAFEEIQFTVLWVPEAAPEQGVETEQVYAVDADAAREQVDAPERIVLGATRWPVELE